MQDWWRRKRIVLLQWEYWPWQIVYLPRFFQYLYYGTTTGFTFPSLLNRPFMRYGGMYEESKWEMHQKSPKHWTPTTLKIPKNHQGNALAHWLKTQPIDFPIILKPDRGMRGKGIHKINNYNELKKLNLALQFDYLAQQFIDYPKEVGVFCIKNPINNTWEITSLMERVFFTLTGDGQSTLEALLRKDDRFFLQLKRLRKSNDVALNKVLAKNEILKLEAIGNHRLGTQFCNAQQHNTVALKKAMAQICESLHGFEYGRFDLKFDSWQDLEQLKNFAILEVNGANAEPAHIYDAQISLGQAWRITNNHFKQLHLLAKQAKVNGEKSTPIGEAFHLSRRFSKAMRQLN